MLYVRKKTRKSNGKVHKVLTILLVRLLLVLGVIVNTGQPKETIYFVLPWMFAIRLSAYIHLPFALTVACHPPEFQNLLKTIV